MVESNNNEVIFSGMMYIFEHTSHDEYNNIINCIAFSRHNLCNYIIYIYAFCMLN